MGKKRRGQPKMLDDQLRDAVRKSGLTSYRIAKDAGIFPDQIDKFLRGADIRVSTAARIARVLGVELLRPKK